MKKIHYKHPKLVNFHIVILVFLILINCKTGFTQSEQRLNRDMEAIAKPTSKAGWIEFKKEIVINPLTLFSDHKIAFGLSESDEMKLRKTETDEIGFTHHRYQQLYKGVPVEGADYIVHTNNEGKTYSANGKIIQDLNSNIVPSIDSKSAIEKALQFVNAKEYKWQSKFWMDKLKEKTKNVNATYYPQAELVFCKGRNSTQTLKENYKLVYRIDVEVSGSGLSKRIYLDAISGEVTKELKLESNCASANVNTIFNGSKTIYTKDISLIGTNYILKDNCQTADIHVQDFNNSTSNPNPTEITSTNNTWNTNNNQKFGGTALWSVKKAYNYFLNVHGRNSHDDSNGNTEVLINAVFEDDKGNYYTNNASMSFTGGNMKIGLGSTMTLTNSYSTLDILSHEYAHGVTGTSAELEYEDESGALNESFSDIFGEMVEYYVNGNADFLVGAERDSGYSRSMVQPKDKGQPNTYKRDNWYTGTDDEGGVHRNSGVQNYWFYLLVNGGNITNDNGEHIEVSGIGITKARDIAYRNLVHYLSSQSQYPDAREGAIKAAEDLYGSCSNEAIQVGKAWFAVGVGPMLSAYDIELCGTISGTFLGIPFPVYRGINSVVSPGSSCSIATVDLASGSVTFAGGNFVELKEGFLVSDYGSNSFTAMTDECSFTYHLKNGNTLTDLEEEQGQIEKQNEGLKLNCFPNPFSSIINLKCTPNSTGELKIEVMDIQGKIIKLISQEISEKGISFEIPLDLEDIPAGFYFLRVSDGIKSSVQKIIKS